MRQQRRRDRRFGTDAFQRSNVLLAAGPGAKDLRRYVVDQAGFSGLQSCARDARLRVSRRDLHQRVAHPRLGRICAENPDPPHDVGQRVFELESRCEHGADFGKQTQLALVDPMLAECPRRRAALDSPDVPLGMKRAALRWGMETHSCELHRL